MLLIQKYASLIEGQFYGHDHVDEVRIQNKCKYATPDGTTSNVQSCDGEAVANIYIGELVVLLCLWTAPSNSLYYIYSQSYIYETSSWILLYPNPINLTYIKTCLWILLYSNPINLTYIKTIFMDTLFSFLFFSTSFFVQNTQDQQ